MRDLPNYALIHGGGQAGWVWAETIAALDRQNDGTIGRIVALDVPGCGSKRGRATAGLVMSDVARELIADIEAAGLRDVILVGHSQAGQTLPIMARMRPDLFRRLVYVTCSAPLPGQNVGEMMGVGLRGSSDAEIGWPIDPVASKMSERFEIMFCNDMDKEKAAAFLARLGQDMWPPQTYTERGWVYDDLGEIPASYVLCLKDMALPVAWQEKFAKRLRVDRTIRIDAGHRVMNTRPHALAEILRIEGRLKAENL
jgi:pimeloyl-ACP methyl ester carboxylesterase